MRLQTGITITLLLLLLLLIDIDLRPSELSLIVQEGRVKVFKQRRMTEPQGLSGIWPIECKSWSAQIGCCSRAGVV